MNTAELLDHLHKRGLEITAEGDHLKVSPSGRLTKDEVAELRNHKAMLLQILNRPEWAAGCHPVPCGNELGWRKSPDEQAPFSPIAEEEPTHGACLHCKRDTGAMLTTPDGLIAWCCPDCFAKRAGECKAAA